MRMVAALALVAMLGASCPSTAQSADGPYRWGYIPIGGGGYITGMVFHPSSPGIAYARSDVGGMYRWDEPAQRWTQLADGFGRDLENYYGVESIALDSRDDKTVYAAAGKTFHTAADLKPNAILKSTDRGATWKPLRTGGNAVIGIAGNGEFRWGGERLEVDAGTGSVYFGSRAQGLWRTDASGTLRRVSAFPTTGGTFDPPREHTNAIGITFVALDRRAEPAGSPTKIIYAGTFDKGVYKSSDGGATWRLLPGSPRRPNRIAFDSAHNAYVTHSGKKSAGGTVEHPGGVAKFVPGNPGSWSDVTPPAPAADPDPARNFSAITVDPADPKVLMTGREIHGSNNPLYRTTDGGASWVRLVRDGNVIRKNSVPWWPESYWASRTASMTIDPHKRDRVWFSDWYGTWRSDDITRLDDADPSTKPTFTNPVTGMENTSLHTLKSTPGSPLRTTAGPGPRSARGSSAAGA